jgi:hypothetical protein
VCADLEAFILSPEQLMRRATPRLARPASCSSTSFRHLVNCPRRLVSRSPRTPEEFRHFFERRQERCVGTWA